MTLEINCNNKYPEWYRLERETEKTIKKLSRLEELKFYLKSPDEYFRRLAILRVNDLKLKDAVGILEEILDNPGESKINKELAAWSIKSICLRWNIELYISNKLIYKFTGREKYHEIHRISIEDSSSNLQVEFASAPIISELEVADDQNQQNQEINIETYVSFQEWLPIYLNELMVSGRQKGFSLTKKLLMSGLDKIKGINIFSLSKKLTLIIKYLGANSHKTKSKSVWERNASGYKIERKRIPLGTLISNVLCQFIQIFTYPIGLLVRNKSCAIAAICLVYYLLTFTDTGISFTRYHFGVSLIEMQNNLFHSDLMETRDEIHIVVKKVLLIAWVQVKDIADWIYIKWLEEIGVK